MATLALTPAAVQKLFELIHTLVPGATETVVLDTDLSDCYPGLDPHFTPIGVDLDVTGSFTLPIGVNLVIEVMKLDPGTGMFSLVPSTVTVTTSGRTVVTINAADHGVNEGCTNFLIYFVAVYPGSPPRRRILLIKAFQICDRCANTPPQPENEAA